MNQLPSADVFSHALALPESDRVQLAGMLLASVKPPGSLSVDDPDFDAVLARRQQELRDGTAKTYSADETIAAMREAVSKRSQR